MGDFTATGPKKQLDWCEAMMKEATILNRIIRLGKDGLEYEADPRQVEKLLEDLEMQGEGVNSVCTPSTKPLSAMGVSAIRQNRVVDGVTEAAGHKRRNEVGSMKTMEAGQKRTIRLTT